MTNKQKALEAFETLVIEAGLEGIGADHLLKPIRAYMDAPKPEEVQDALDEFPKTTGYGTLFNFFVKHEKAIRAALEAFGGGWRTIDSAPMDGTTILVHIEDYGVTTAWNSAEKHNGDDEWHYETRWLSNSKPCLLYTSPSPRDA